METNNLLNRINNCGERRRKAEKEEENAIEREITSCENAIISYMDRICELHKITKALVKNDIRNGFMITDSIRHGIGFYSEEMIAWGSARIGDDPSAYPSVKFGIKGGGCCGGDLIIDPINHTISYTGRRGEWNHLSKLKKIAWGFDKWEKEVIERIEAIV